MKYKLGQLYLFEFWDHTCGGSRTLAKTKTVGWVVDETELAVVISTWYIISTDAQFVNDNHEVYTLLKGALIKSKCLARMENDNKTTTKKTKTKNRRA